jgi:hypothetical protein
MSDLYIKKTSRLPALNVVLYAPGIEAATSATFNMKIQGGSTTKTGTATINGSPRADQLSVTYNWGATDTDTVGVWNCEFWVIVGGKRLTLPNDRYLTVEVLADVS